MAIQISGTTVIDNSRNFTNIGTLTATSFSGKGAIPASSVMLFEQANAPTGFTKSITHNDKILRVVSGTGGGSGGTNSFSSTFPATSVSLSATADPGSTTLTTPQIPSHGHTGIAGGAVAGGGVNNRVRIPPATQPSGFTGSNISHTHSPFPMTTSISLAVQYVDVIIATRDA